MNREKLLELLKQSLSNFLVHGNLIEELIGLLKQSGSETSFLAIFRTRLKFLSERGLLATKHREFEPIEQGIYSMHVTGSSFNIRILYGFLSDGTPALLLAFYERSGHRKTDYSTYLAPALRRLDELKKEVGSYE